MCSACSHPAIVRSSVQSELIDSIVEFLAKPYASGGTFKHKVGSKRKGIGGMSGSRKKKDKNDGKPKKAPSSYIIFTNEYRGDMQKSYPDLKVTADTSVANRRWPSCCGAHMLILVFCCFAPLHR